MLCNTNALQCQCQCSATYCFTMYVGKYICEGCQRALLVFQNLANCKSNLALPLLGHS
jgi:hypothetical protein